MPPSRPREQRPARLSSTCHDRRPDADQRPWTTSPESHRRLGIEANSALGKTWLSLGHPDLALQSGDRTLAACEVAGLVDFDFDFDYALSCGPLAACPRP